MQLLFPKPNAAMMNEAMMTSRPSWLINTNEQFFQPKFPTQHLPPGGFNLPPVFNQRMQMVFGTRSRRRRSNHSLVATMDPVAVARRNERERNRVKQVNDGFDALKKCVPFLPDKKKLSKVEILRYAMMYIRDLKDIVDEYDHNNASANSKTRKNSEGSTGSDDITEDFCSNSDTVVAGGDFCENVDSSVVDDFLFDECGQSPSLVT